MTTATQSSATQSATKPALGRIARATGFSIIIAVVLDLVLYGIGVAGGWLPVLAVAGEVNLAPVLLFSVVPPIIGALLYYFLSRFLKQTTANIWFLVLASLVLLGMTVGPITNLVDPTVGAVMLLEIMHLAVGLPVMYFLIRT